MSLLEISSSDQLGFLLRDHRRWYGAAASEIQEILEAGTAEPATTALDALLAKFQQQVHLVDDALSSPNSSDFDRNSLAEAKASLPQRLAATIALVSPKSGDAAEVERRLGIRVNDRLDHGAVWREAHLTVRVPPTGGKGQWRSFQSAVIPLNKAFALYTAAMNFLPYGRGGFSSNSLSRGSMVEPSRLANGWLTMLHSGVHCGLHSGGRELFSGFRSGALGAASIGDAKGREESGRMLGQGSPRVTKRGRRQTAARRA